MDKRFQTQLFVVAFCCGAIHSSCHSQQGECAPATTPPQSLSCVVGVSPISIQPLASGALYVSATDQSRTSYSTYLYPDQSNAMPATHRAKGEAIAASIQPLDENGNVDLANGKILAIAEGMSNTGMEMDALETLFIQGNPVLHPKLEFRNLSQGGCDLVCWVEKGVESIDRQVQVALVKHSNNRRQQADGTPQSDHGPFTTRESKFFPNHALETKKQLKQRILNLKKQYPNLRIVYFTSRTFGGWSCEPAGNEYREPVAFEEGFSVKWLVEDQVLGRDPELAFEGNSAPAPWLAWGPYLWDPTLTQDMFRGDGTHPCDTGRAAIAQMWYDFLLNDSTARLWFRNLPTPVELGIFRALSDGADVLLEWTTESEFTNLGFEIERQRGADEGADGDAWLKIAFVRGNGTTASRNHYSYVDADLSPGRYRYRLKQLDIDGSFEYSGSIEIEVSRPAGFALFQNFPNPSYGGTELRYHLREKSEVALTIYNLQGQKVRTLFKGLADAGVYRVEWNGLDDHRRPLPSGTYLYRLQAGQVSLTKRLVLIK